MKKDKKTEKELRQFYDNMNNDVYYIRGEHDSSTNKKVMASRYGNYFGPESCFFDYKENLEPDTYYIDCEATPSGNRNKKDVSKMGIARPLDVIVSAHNRAAEMVQELEDAIGQLMSRPGANESDDSAEKMFMHMRIQGMREALSWVLGEEGLGVLNKKGIRHCPFVVGEKEKENGKR